MIYLILAAQAITLILVAWLIVLRQKPEEIESSSDQLSSPEPPAGQTEETSASLNANGLDDSAESEHQGPHDTPALWLNAAEREESEGAKLDILEDALKRYPSSRELFSSLVEMLIPLCRDSENMYVRRKALSTLQEYTDLFQSHCSLVDYSYGQEVGAGLRELAEVLDQEMVRQMRADVTYKLDSLEEQVHKLVTQNGSSTEGEIDKLAILDESINKSVLNRDDDLKKRYDNVSEQMILFFRNQDKKESKVDIQEYSKKAVKAAKQAWNIFQDNENKSKWLDDDKVDYNKRIHLRKLVKHLGGWQSQFMTPETSVYVQSVYSDIFQTLSPEGRARMTTMMIESDKVEPYE